MKKIALISVLGLVLTAFFGAAPAQGAAIYLDQSTFVALLQPGYYLENYSGYSGGEQAATMNFSQGGFSYSANAPNGLWINTALGNAFSTNRATDTITFTFTSGNVTAVGGYFYGSDLNGLLTAGNIVLNLSDGASQTLVNPGTTSFAGFTTSGGVFITSLTVASQQTSAAVWPTVDDFYVGAAEGNVPEPSTFVLMALGAGALVLARKLRRS